MNAVTWQSPIGWIRVVAGRQGVRRIEFHPHKEGLAGKGATDCPERSHDSGPLLREARRQIDAYLAGALRNFDLPLDLSGLAPFSRKVLQELTKIPYGATVSYAELARLAGSPGAARAVGGVMASNPLPIVIPCHRVVTASGRLGGYSGGEGLVSKRRLLAHEGALAEDGS